MLQDPHRAGACVAGKGTVWRSSWEFGRQGARITIIRRHLPASSPLPGLGCCLPSAAHAVRLFVVDR
jgi:hypothetical protein